MRHWYVVRSKPNRERVVAEQLRREGWETFFPTARVHAATGPRSAREKSYFPGYLFVRVDLAAVGISKLRWIPAGLGLLEFGGVPANVADSFIFALKRRIAEIQAAGGLVLDGLKQGDTVKIVSGPFAGYEAVFDLRLKDSDRVRVMLEMLRRRVGVELKAGQIVRVRS